jgi:hypothetical protein
MDFTPETTKEGPLTRVGMKMTLPKADTSARGKIRKQINDEVGDVYSLLADANEMISLLMSAVSILHSAQSEEALAAIPDVNKRAFLEYAIAKFAGTTTSADLKFEADPTGTVNALMDGQAAIGSIMNAAKTGD